MRLREKLARLEDTVRRAKQFVDTRPALRAAALASLETLDTLDTSPPPKPPPPRRELPDFDVDTWPHPWPKVWWHLTYLRDGTVFPPGTRLVVENDRGESNVIDADRIEKFREHGWKVVNVDEVMWKNMMGQRVFRKP